MDDGTAEEGFSLVAWIVLLEAIAISLIFFATPYARRLREKRVLAKTESSNVPTKKRQKDDNVEVSRSHASKQRTEEEPVDPSVRPSRPLPSPTISSVRVTEGVAYFEISRGDSSEWKRYSEFRDMRRELRRQFGEDVIPSFPPKRYLGSSVERRFLEKRKTALNRFLVAIRRKQVLRESAIVRKFLNVPSTSSTSSLSSTTANDTSRDVSRPSSYSTLLTETKRSLDRWIFERGEWNEIVHTDFVQVHLHSTLCTGGVICSKTEGVVEAPVRAVVDLIWNTKRKPEYDKNFKKAAVLEELDVKRLSRETGMDVRRAIVRRTESMSPIPQFLSPRDSVNLIAVVREGDTSVIVVASVTHKDGPEDEAYVRASVCGGFRFRPMKDEPHRTIWNSAVALNINGQGLPWFVLKRVAPKQALENFRSIRKAATDRSKWPPEETTPEKKSSD